MGGRRSGARASALLASALFQGLVGDAAGQVSSVGMTGEGLTDCGGHFASGCSGCPQGNGAVWCNGDCTWVLDLHGGQCMPKPFLPGMPNTDIGANFYYWLLAFVSSGGIMFIYACVYFKQVIFGPPELPKVPEGLNATGKRYGLFDCLSHPNTCLYVTFCLPIVAGKNYYAARICGFWPGCCFTYCLTYSPFYCVSALIRAFLSGMVRERLGHETSCCLQFLYSFFCYPCDVGRESLEVDQEIGAEINCCCDVTLRPRLVTEMGNFFSGETQACSRSCDKYRVCGH